MSSARSWEACLSRAVSPSPRRRRRSPVRSASGSGPWRLRLRSGPARRWVAAGCQAGAGGENGVVAAVFAIYAGLAGVLFGGAAAGGDDVAPFLLVGAAILRRRSPRPSPGGRGCGLRRWASLPGSFAALALAGGE